MKPGFISSLRKQNEPCRRSTKALWSIMDSFLRYEHKMYRAEGARKALWSITKRMTSLFLGIGFSRLWEGFGCCCLRLFSVYSDVRTCCLQKRCNQVHNYHRIVATAVAANRRWYWHSLNAHAWLLGGRHNGDNEHWIDHHDLATECTNKRTTSMMYVLVVGVSPSPRYLPFFHLWLIQRINAELINQPSSESNLNWWRRNLTSSWEF